MYVLWFCNLLSLGIVIYDNEFVYGNICITMSLGMVMMMSLKEWKIKFKPKDNICTGCI